MFNLQLFYHMFFAHWMEGVMEGIICAKLKNLLVFSVITTSWLLPEVQTIQHKQGVQPLPGAEQTFQFTCLIS